MRMILAVVALCSAIASTARAAEPSPELIAYGKARPGTLSYGVDTTSGYGVVVGRLLNKRGSIGMVEVPYRTTPQLLQETVAGATQVMISSCLLYTSPSPRDGLLSRMPSSA